MSNRLFERLPGIYRLRDQNGQLRALMAVLEQQLDAMRADTETTWDNWFIETCEEWLVPYLGDALGVRGLHDIRAFGFSLRSYVANTIAYRRRKGTAAVVEQLARDLTGYPSVAVEYFAHTVTTVHVQHVREPGAVPALGGTIDLRSGRRLERFGTPFDPHAHRIDVRRIASRRGRYNVPNLGVFSWRVRSFPIASSTAEPIAGSAGGFRFDPLGRDAPLFDLPATEDGIETRAAEHHVPHPLSRRDLCDELTGDLPPRYLGEQPAFRVRAAGVPLAVEIRHLGDPGSPLAAITPAAGTAIVDPLTGRIAVAAGTTGVEVDYVYGFAAELGAGPFDRSESLARQLAGDVIDQIAFRRGVSTDPRHASDGEVVTTLDEAITAWHAFVDAHAGESGVAGIIVLADNRTYTRSAGAGPIRLPLGARLYIVAMGWNRRVDGGLSLIANALRPVIRGSIGATCEGVATGVRQGGLLVNGILVDGELAIDPGDLEVLDLAHCTVASAGASIRVRGANARLDIRLQRCLVRGISADGPLASVTADDTLIHGVAAPGADASTTSALAVAGTPVALGACTVLGTTTARTLEATSCLFAASVIVEQHQQGCVRFSYVPEGSTTPRRYHCQPDLDGIVEPARSLAAARIRPNFVSTDPAHPGYGMLDASTAPELLVGGEGGCEVGVFHHLQHARRIANLRTTLRQYLRFGLEAGLFLDL